MSFVYASEYERALAEYERARECYESLADVLDGFTQLAGLLRETVDVIVMRAGGDPTPVTVFRKAAFDGTVSSSGRLDYSERSHVEQRFQTVSVWIECLGLTIRGRRPPVARHYLFCYTCVKHVYSMSDADAAGGEENGPEMVQINLRLSKAFLEDIDRTWEEQGFNSRSEFLRYTARDAVKHPSFSREGWKQIATSEHELRSGDAELVSREEVLEMMDRDEPGE